MLYGYLSYLELFGKKTPNSDDLQAVSSENFPKKKLFFCNKHSIFHITS